jgi:hypothetical protein
MIFEILFKSKREREICNEICSDVIEKQVGEGAT